LPRTAPRSRASTGAVVTFSVVLHDHDDGRAVMRIEYVAHPSARSLRGSLLTRTTIQRAHIAPRTGESGRDMKSIEQHPADLLDGIGPLEPVDADVLVTLGTVLAADVVSLVDRPVFDSSAISAPCPATRLPHASVRRAQA
jgi:hypothetical protein